MPTYRLDLEYEGTRYHGWQVQANARSVAGELRRALDSCGARVLELGGSGRTDAGVHALAQTAHLRLGAAADSDSLERRVNDGLPPDIHVWGVRRVPDRFHARHDALARSYLYQVSRRRTALAKRFVWWVKPALDERRMGEAARVLVGRHDFARLCERPTEQESTLVELVSAEVVASGDLVLVRLVASHFLWKMVRRVVGVLVRIGTGEGDSDLLAQLLSADDRTDLPQVASWTAPPSGLFLERVLYPGEPPLAPIAPAVAVARRAVAAERSRPRR